MKFLLIGFVIVVAIIGISIIALAYFSARSKEEKEVKTSQPSAAKRKLWPIIAIIILLLLIGWGVSKKSIVSGSYPVATDAQDIWPHIGETVKVKIYPDRWSGWINVPPGARCMIDTPGEFEYLFWTGERIVVHNKELKWLGDIKSYSFRLRGVGDATITIQ